MPPSKSPPSLPLHNTMYVPVPSLHACFYFSILVPDEGRDVLLVPLGRRLIALTLQAWTLLGRTIPLVWLRGHFARGKVMYTALWATKSATRSWCKSRQEKGGRRKEGSLYMLVNVIQEHAYGTCPKNMLRGWWFVGRGTELATDGAGLQDNNGPRPPCASPPILWPLCYLAQAWRQQTR